LGQFELHVHCLTSSKWQLTAWNHSGCDPLFSNEAAQGFDESLDVGWFMLGGGWRGRSAIHYLASGEMTENGYAAG
jgi:hypothetical protein